MKFDDDALDRALFALPLEEPPAGLRASILTQTLYRPAPMFSLLEVAVLGAIVALLVVLGTLLVMGGGTLFIHSLEAIVNVAERELFKDSTLLWIAAGGATAVWLSVFTGFQPAAVSYRKGDLNPNR